MLKYARIIALVLMALGLYLLFDHFKKSANVKPAPLMFISEENWQDFTVSDEFSVKFPNAPENTTQTVENKETLEKRAYNIYISESFDGKLYMISVITFSDEMTKLQNQELMNKIVMEAVDRKEGNSLQKITPTTFQNLPALDFKIAGTAKSVEGTVVIKGKKLYLLTEIMPMDQTDSQFSFFRNSFRLLGGN